MTKLKRLSLAFLLIAGCARHSQLSNGIKPKVVATTTVLCDLIQTIAQKTVDLDCLIKPGFDPHIYQPNSQNRQAIEQAQVIFYSGYDFEKPLTKLFANKNNTVAVGELAVPHPQTFAEDGKKVIDPHIFQNARNGQAMAKVIAINLSNLNPNQTSSYIKRADYLVEYLGQINSWIASEIATIPVSSRKLVTTHDALGYYSTAYNIPLEGALQGVNTEERPTAKHIQELVQTIRASRVPTIFAELSINAKLIEAIAKEAKVKISPQKLYADGLGEMGSSGESYPKMLIANTQNITRGLGGKLINPPAEKPR